MNHDSLIEVRFLIGPWKSIKPSGSKYITHGGYGVLQGDWAFFWIQINYARKKEADA